MGHSVPPIPESLRENLAYGLGPAEAERWLGQAVQHAEELFVSWDLTPQQVLAGGSESLCVKCEGPDGSPLVLKLPASLSGGETEIAALRVWGGDGAARLLRAEPGLSAMLMNFLGRVGEGTYTLAEVLDLADRLHEADLASHDFPSVEANVARRLVWAAERFAEPGGEAAAADLAVAEKLLGHLLYGGDRHVLLHGDLQPKNLIVSDQGLAVVDPMPAVGPAVFDTAFWIVKCAESHPLATCQSAVLALRPDLDADALQRWCWALAVVESRPYLGPANVRRTEYIEQFRDRH